MTSFSLFTFMHWRRKWQPTPVFLPGESQGQRSLVGCRLWGAQSRTRLSDFIFTFHFHALKKEMATHSSVLAWRIPGMGEPGGLPSMGSHRVGHNWSDLVAAVAAWTGLEIYKQRIRKYGQEPKTIRYVLKLWTLGSYQKFTTIILTIVGNILLLKINVEYTQTWH